MSSIWQRSCSCESSVCVYIISYLCVCLLVQHLAEELQLRIERVALLPDLEVHTHS